MPGVGPYLPVRTEHALYMHGVEYLTGMTYREMGRVRFRRRPDNDDDDDGWRCRNNHTNTL